HPKPLHRRSSFVSTSHPMAPVIRCPRSSTAPDLLLVLWADIDTSWMNDGSCENLSHSETRTGQGDDMTVEMMQRVVDETTNIVDNVKTDQLGNATPCAEWNVRDVLNHIVGGSTMFAVSAEQGTVPDEMVGQLMGGDCLGDDFKAAWAVSSKRA